MTPYAAILLLLRRTAVFRLRNVRGIFPGQLLKFSKLLLPEIGEFFGLFWIFGREVVVFGSVLGQVVELPLLVVRRDELPVTLADSAIFFVQPPEEVALDFVIRRKRRR